MAEVVMGHQPWDYLDRYADRPPPWRRLLVERQLRLTAQRTPNAPALVCDGTTLTYRELDALADRAANGLLSGTRANPGDVIGLVCPNLPETLPMMIGIARAGMTVVPVNPMNTADEIAFQLGDVHATMLIGGDGDGPTAAQLIAAGEPTPPDVEVDENTPFWARFTSGTTGKPRAYTVSNRALALLTTQLAAELNYRNDDVLLINAPLAHAAVAFAMAGLAVGATVVVAPSFDPATIWTECDEHGVTQLFMVPTMVSMALTSPGAGASIRRMCISASTLPPVLADKITARFPHVDLTTMYGASELGMITTLHGRESAGRVGSVGLARYGYSLKILDEDGNPLPPGQVGTIYVQGPSMSEGFIGSVPAPENVVRDGWVTPGDMGSVDEDGFLYLADRRSDLILSGGMNVYPAEVENTLLEVDGVLEAAVVGIDDEVWGQRVTAVIVGDADPDTLDVHCRQRLAGYKIPRSYHFVDEIPLSPARKPLRRMVRDCGFNGVSGLTR